MKKNLKYFIGKRCLIEVDPLRGSYGLVERQMTRLALYNGIPAEVDGDSMLIESINQWKDVDEFKPKDFRATPPRTLFDFIIQEIVSAKNGYVDTAQAIGTALSIEDPKRKKPASLRLRALLEGNPKCVDKYITEIGKDNAIYYGSVHLGTMLFHAETINRVIRFSEL